MRLQIITLVFFFFNFYSFADSESACVFGAFKSRTIVLTHIEGMDNKEVMDELSLIGNKEGYLPDLGFKMVYIKEKNSKKGYILLNKTSNARPYHSDLINNFKCPGGVVLDFETMLGGYLNVEKKRNLISKIDISNRSISICTNKSDLMLPASLLASSIGTSTEKAIKNGVINLFHTPNLNGCTENGLKKKKIKLPIGIENLEIEAKWEIRKSSPDSIMKEIFEDLKDSKSARKILNLESVKSKPEASFRFGGRPAKFVDYYFANSEGRKLSLRHRTRYSSKNVPKNLKGTLNDLRNSEWRFDWDKVQFKHSPYIDKPIWYRKEVGNCFLEHKKPNSRISDMCYQGREDVSVDDILNRTMSHPAIESIPNLYLGSGSLKNIYKTVEDYRYRIIINSRVSYYSKKLNLKEYNFEFELSLDRVHETICLKGDSLANCEERSGINRFEVELEIIDADENEQSAIFELYRIAEIIQKKYELTPSVEAKSGL